MNECLLIEDFAKRRSKKTNKNSCFKKAEIKNKPAITILVQSIMASLKLLTTLKSSNPTTVVLNVKSSLLNKSLGNQKRFYAILLSVQNNLPYQLSPSDPKNKCGKHAVCIKKQN